MVTGVVLDRSQEDFSCCTTHQRCLSLAEYFVWHVSFAASGWSLMRRSLLLVHIGKRLEGLLVLFSFRMLFTVAFSHQSFKKWERRNGPEQFLFIQFHSQSVFLTCRRILFINSLLSTNAHWILLKRMKIMGCRFWNLSSEFRRPAQKRVSTLAFQTWFTFKKEVECYFFLKMHWMCSHRMWEVGTD